MKIRLSNHLSGQVDLISDISQSPVKILSNLDKLFKMILIHNPPSFVWIV
jgi:hypothetical protein